VARREGVGMLGQRAQAKLAVDRRIVGSEPPDADVR
jgi:hypothetical protein